VFVKVTKQIVLSKDGKPVSFDVERTKGERVGKSVVSAGTVDFSANTSSGYRVTLTTTPRELVKKDKFRENIRKESQNIVGKLPVMLPATSTGILVLEYDEAEEGKIIEALTKAIQNMKFKGFWIF
jgi:hypothetical protein